MRKDPEVLFHSLTAGDELVIPISPPAVHQTIILSAAVLRVDDQGRIYLSKPTDDRPTATAFAACNPFRWSTEKGALVDCDGDVPRWYNTDIMLERGGAKQAAAEYALVPRSEDVSHTLTDADLEAFKASPKMKLIAGIARNGDVDNPTDQLSLVLDVLGITYTNELLIGLDWLRHCTGQTSHLIAVIPISVGTDSDPDSGNG